MNFGKRHFLLILLVMIACRSIAAVGPPVLHCTVVLANGYVALTWTKPADPQNEFLSYQIFASVTRNGTYSQIQTIPNIANTSYTDITANANINPKYYYVSTAYGTGVLSKSSDTLAAMTLTVSKPSNNAIAYLSWPALRNPLPATATSVYQIYKSISNGPFNLFTTTPKAGFADTNNTYCDSTKMDYRIEVSDNLGCSSISSTNGKVFIDDQSPLYTPIERVSVDTATGKTTLYWRNNPSTDTKGYKIVQKDGLGQYVVVGTVSAPNLSYTYNGSSPGTGSETFSVYAYDGCGTGNNGPYLKPGHNTIYLTAQLEKCTQSIVLNWTPYQSWAGGVNRYEVYVGENGSGYVFLTNTTSGITTYRQQNIQPGVKYRYLVKAIDNTAGSSLISLSNKTNELDYSTPTPTQSLIKAGSVIYGGFNGSVQDNQKVLIQFDSSTFTVPGLYYLLRSNNNVQFDTIAKIQDKTSQYIDGTANTGSQSYYYKLIKKDECNSVAITSNIAQTILLQSHSVGGFLNSINWNPITGFNGTVDVVRNYSGQSTIIAQNQPYANLSVTDDISNDIKTDSRFCYVLIAKNTADTTKITYSNIACIDQIPLLYVPSAFTPNGDGKNEVFKPILNFVDASTYTFVILSRYGTEIFRTNDPNESWDGTYNGNDCPQGVYAYTIMLNIPNNGEFEKQGAVTLIR
jgi:gliding motility-associated-like protein